LVLKINSVVYCENLEGKSFKTKKPLKKFFF